MHKVFILLALFPTLLQAQPLTLEECIARALDDNTDVRLSQQSVLRARADLKSVRADYLPSVNATLFGYTRSRTGSSVRIQENPSGEVDPETGQRILREESTLIPGIDRNSYSFSTSLNQTLYDAGRRANNYAAAQRDLTGTEYGFSSSQLDVTAQVKRRYFDLLKARELVEVQEEAVTLSEKQLENARARLEVGSGTEVDVLRLRVALDNARAQLINNEQSVIIARANLNHIMGASIRTPLEVVPLQEGQWNTPVLQDSLAPLIERAQQHNPNLLRLDQAALAAEHGIAAAHSAYRPRLGGNVSYSRNNEVFDSIYQDLNRSYRLNVGVSLTYNLFDGGIRRANVDRARTALETAKMNLEQQQREIALAVEVSHLELVRLEKILRIAESTVELAGEDLRLAQERYRVGKGRLLEALDAQVSFTEARSNLVRTRYDMKIAEADLERLVGGW
jgi:outer membrane protein